MLATPSSGKSRAAAVASAACFDACFAASTASLATTTQFSAYGLAFSFPPPYVFAAAPPSASCASSRPSVGAWGGGPARPAGGEMRLELIACSGNGTTKSPP